MVFEYITLLVISSISLLLNSFATSTFLPMALTLVIYFIGQSTMLVKDYLQTAPEAKAISPIVAFLAKGSYYIFPNLAAFDIRSSFVYSLPVSRPYLMIVALYALFYLSVVTLVAVYFFGRRDLAWSDWPYSRWPRCSAFIVSPRWTECIVLIAFRSNPCFCHPENWPGYLKVRSGRQIPWAVSLSVHYPNSWILWPER